jgi:hypothetical protein
MQSVALLTATQFELAADANVKGPQISKCLRK